MGDYFVIGHAGREYFQLPETWEVVNNAVLNLQEVEKSIDQMVDEAITHPAGSLPLAELLKNKDKILIIVDDIARPTPKKEILSALVRRLEKYGIRKNQIDVLIGLGTHRPLTETEIKTVFGERLSSELRITNHDCRSSELVSVGTLRKGGEFKIHPLAAKADFRIAVGSILPHLFNGYGGGAKVVFPGIANYEAIRRHHVSLMVAKGVSLGNMRGNPWHDEICEAARLAKLDFIINAVFNCNEDVKEIVAGHFEKAHELGAEMCTKELGVNFYQAADVTISSAFPYVEGPQIMKPLCPATLVTKKGGYVIIYASDIHGGKFPDSLLEAFDTAFSLAGGDTRKLVLNYLHDGKLIVPDGAIDFNSALNTTLLYLSRVKVILVSRVIDQKQAARLGFGYSRSLDEAITRVSKDIPKATVNILPAGGLVLPLVAKEMSFEW
jgi:nickel-dependent lactate racemase